MTESQFSSLYRKLEQDGEVLNVIRADGSKTLIVGRTRTHALLYKGGRVLIEKLVKEGEVLREV